jgi:hypothetical protein
MTKTDLIEALAELPGDAKIFVGRAANPGMLCDIIHVEIDLNESGDDPVFAILEYVPDSHD